MPSLVDRALYEPTIRAGLRGAAVARRLQTGNVRTYALYLLALVIGAARARADGAARMSARRRRRAAGRRHRARAAAARDDPDAQGAPAGPPRRVAAAALPRLRRLWGKSAVDPEGAGVVYRARAGARGRVPAARARAASRRGRLRRLGARQRRAGARRAARAGALRGRRGGWDTGNGFALMGAARDLMLAVFGEALLVLALLVAALPAQSTDLVAMSDAAAGTDIWGEPAHWCGGAGVRARRARRDRAPADRQPRHAPRADDDPRGPAARVRRPRPRAAALGGRRAPLDRPRARRRAVPAAPGGFAGAPRCARRRRSPCCASRSRSTETAQAKMRILRVPALLALGCLGRARRPRLLDRGGGA